MKKVKLRSAADVDKEVIAEGMSSSNRSPFTSPKTTPMLPPETWENIFHEFHSTDFLSVINAAPEWNHLLSSRKTVELFQHVLPFVMEFLPQSDFLQLRFACRAWKRGLDFVYENHPSRLAAFGSFFTFPTSTKHELIDMGVTFQTLDSIQRFTASMNSDCGNPFPGRCVHLELKREFVFNADAEYNFEEDPIDGPEYWASLDSLLTQFGSHIWYLQVDYYLADWDDSDVEARLRNIFHLVPNLRKLSLGLQTEEYGEFKDEEWAIFNDRVIASFLAEPPSKLDKLESAFFSSGCNYGDKAVSPVLLQLVKSYCVEGNLKRLGIPDISYSEPIPFPELVELWAILDFNGGPQLKAASPKLEKLIVQFPCLECNISTVFDVLHHFGETLKDLRIEESVVSINQKHNNYKIELPKLERLCFNYSLPTHHLFALKSLKYLEINKCLVFQDKKEYVGLFRQLPKLRKIVHKNDVKRAVVTRRK